VAVGRGEQLADRHHITKFPIVNVCLLGIRSGQISTRGVAKVNFLSITQNGKRMCAWLEEVQSGVQWVRPSVAKPFASDRP
jgi:hypothetical protein